MDRRRHQRYDFEATLRFSWKDSGGIPKRAEGLLRDISGGGAFVWSDDLPSTGAEVRFELPVRSVLRCSRLVIQAKGQVLRVEESWRVGARRGFSAAITTMALSNEKGEVE